MASPEMSGIALGLFCALGIFALKTAVGNYYFLALPGQPFRKTAAVILMQSAYALVFVLAFGLLGHFDFLQAANAGSFLKNGVLIHLLLCGGLFWWGIRLLVRQDSGTPDRIDSHGWLLLTLPCPVCAAAIFLVCAFALMLFPESARSLRVLLPLSFLLLNALFLGLLVLFRKICNLRPLELTARMMILIALYFTLILLIAPHFQEAGKLYAMAKSGGPSEQFTLSHLPVPGIALISLAAGFFLNIFCGKRS